MKQPRRITKQTFEIRCCDTKACDEADWMKTEWFVIGINSECFPSGLSVAHVLDASIVWLFWPHLHKKSIVRLFPPAKDVTALNRRCLTIYAFAWLDADISDKFIG